MVQNKPEGPSALGVAPSEVRAKDRGGGALLNNLSPRSIVGEGRVYGGGLHKLEPKELGNVDAATIVDTVPELRTQSRPIQSSLFDRETA